MNAGIHSVDCNKMYDVFDGKCEFFLLLKSRFSLFVTCG